MSQLVITETMRAILVYMGSHDNQSSSIMVLDRVLRDAPIGKVHKGYDDMWDERLWRSGDERGLRVLTVRGKVLAANIIELTRNRGK